MRIEKLSEKVPEDKRNTHLGHRSPLLLMTAMNIVRFEKIPAEPHNGKETWEELMLSQIQGTLVLDDGINKVRNKKSSQLLHLQTYHIISN